MISVQEATEMHEAEVLVETFNCLNDVITQEGLTSTQVVDQVLSVIDANFYLVPKREVAVDDQLVIEPAPEGALEDGIYKLWANVSN